MNLITKEKPYNSLTKYYIYKYNKKTAKIALNANFTCPNKDGTKGFGGCIYCSKLGSGDFAGDKEKSITEQFNDIRKIMDEKWPDSVYIPYFQANSNTYASVEVLKSVYQQALSVCPEKTVGIAIATRPDCISDEVIDYLGELNQKIPVQIELGLQTSNEKTAEYINRCSTNNEFISAVQRLRAHNIEVVAHIINGLPYETRKDMMNTLYFLNAQDIQGIKVHCLLVLKDTVLAHKFATESFPMLSLEEYVDITVEQITHMRPDIIIHRLTADSSFEDLIEPQWARKKLVVMNEIDKKLRKNKEYQGIYYKK